MNDQHTPGPGGDSAESDAELTAPITPQHAAEPAPAEAEVPAAPEASEQPQASPTLQFPAPVEGSRVAGPPSQVPGAPQVPLGAPAPGPYGTPPPSGSPFGAPIGGGPFPPPPGAAGYGYPVAPAPRAKVSKAVWPVVCLLSLLLGLVGGALGAMGYDKWQDDNTEPGRSRDGLAGVQTETTPPLTKDNKSIEAVASKLLPSTVQIIADFEGEEGGATGSGFVLDRQGHVVTNNHVIEDAAKKDGRIRIVLHDGTRYDATVVGRSTVYDLAVLYSKDAIDELVPASLGESAKLRVGEGVVAFGSPLGLTSTVTAGIISALNRPVTTGGTDDLNSYINAIQTDAAINPGNSGGPLVNLQGQVIGVNSAIATTGGGGSSESGNIGVGFAIPVEQVRVTADQILKDGEAQYPVIGASVITADNREGVRIEKVNPGSAAEKAGLKKNDVVVEIAGQPVNDSPSLIVAIRSHLPGEKVILTVERGGKEREVTVTLDSQVG
ncbi:trypsin-like peptidase domain-containing protein [Nocardioides sp. Bht2]|uniref:S1C family serine protease n=1 Tax=Nocardioides sp. Bht2 TaxID=3392297 RepID=UPI0039B39191